MRTIPPRGDGGGKEAVMVKRMLVMLSGMLVAISPS
jgi:hypothetical protein